MTVQITTLDGGLRVVTDTMRELETVALGVWIEAGSRDEKKSEQGVAHFLEHMLFKGTKRRDARAIAEEIENVGGDLNGATTTENTSFNARVLAEDMGLALDIIGDVLTESVFDPKEVAREKSVVIQEIGEMADMPDDLVFDQFNAAAWPDQAFGRSILGEIEGVKSFTSASVAAWAREKYTRPISVVAAAGAVEHERIVEEARKRLSALPVGKGPLPREVVYRGGDTRAKRKLEQTHVVIGFEGPSYHAPETWAASVFASAVGGGAASRLFQEVREKRGLSYSIYAFHNGYSDTGVMGFAASCAHRDARELAHVSLDCLAECVETLTEAEVRRARAAMKLSLLAALESPAGRADQIARQVLAFGRVLSRTEISDKIDALTLDEIRAAGRAALRTAPTVSVVGDVGKTPDPVAVRERIAGV